MVGTLEQKPLANLKFAVVWAPLQCMTISTVVGVRQKISPILVALIGMHRGGHTKARTNVNFKFVTGSCFKIPISYYM